VGYQNPLAADQTLENANWVIDDFSELQKLL
jgi:beta-phosphoglucomutase